MIRISESLLISCSVLFRLDQSEVSHSVSHRIIEPPTLARKRIRNARTRFVARRTRRCSPNSSLAPLLLRQRVARSAAGPTAEKPISRSVPLNNAENSRTCSDFLYFLITSFVSNFLLPNHYIKSLCELYI